MNRLDRLLRALDGAVRAVPHAPVEDAFELSDALGDPRLLPSRYRRSSPDRYRANVVHVADDGAFSLVAVVWRPGQGTPVHSHRAWCVVGLHEGVETETVYTVDDERPQPSGLHRYQVGDVTWLD